MAEGNLFPPGIPSPLQPPVEHDSTIMSHMPGYYLELQTQISEEKAESQEQ